MKKLFFAIFVFNFACWATLPQTVRWNVEKTTGASDTNGGGFDTAKTGTDYSQSVNNAGSCAAKLHIDGSTVTATASSTTLTFTGGTHTVTTTEAGNLVYLGVGTSLTVGWYEITAVSAGLNGTWTLERTTGMSGGAVTGYMGGCLANPQQAITNVGNAATSPSAIDQTSYIKVGTSAYALAAALTPTTMADYNYQERVFGYATSQTDRGLLTVSAASNAAAAVLTVAGHLLGTSGTITLCDVKGGTGNWAAVNGVRTITLLDTNTFSIPVNSTSFGTLTGTITVSVRPLLTAASGANGITLSAGQCWEIGHLILDGLSAGVQGILGGVSYNRFVNVWVKNFTAECWQLNGGNQSLFAVEASGCGGTSAMITGGEYGAFTLTYSYIHDSTGKTGVSTGGGNIYEILIGNVIANNSGSTSDGAGISYTPNTVIGNLFYHNGRDGLSCFGWCPRMSSMFINNRFEYNGRYGIYVDYANSYLANTTIDYNSYWGNVTGAVYHITQGPHDVNAAVDPSVAATATPPNFGLNTTTTGGKLLQGVGPKLPGIGNTGYVVDIGPLRHTDPTAAAGGGSYSWVR